MNGFQLPFILENKEEQITMNSPFGSSMNEVNMIAKLADIKEEHYHQLVTLSAIMELLVEKGILSRAEIERKAAELDQFIDQPPYPTV